MFEVGFTEIILILGLALLVLGPEKLPGLAQKVGRWTGRARAMARQLQTQLEQEVSLNDLANSKPMSSGTSEPASPYDPAPSGASATWNDAEMEAAAAAESEAAARSAAEEAAPTTETSAASDIDEAGSPSHDSTKAAQ